MAGPDTGPVRIVTPPGTVIIGARFRSAAGGPALRLPLSEIRDQRVDLADLLPETRVPAATRQLAAALSADLGPAAALQKVLALTRALAGEGAPDEAVAYAASLLRDPAVRSDQVTAVVGLSERQLRRRFHAAVGDGPKTLQRVYRFRRFVQRVDERGAGEQSAAEVRVGDLRADERLVRRAAGALGPRDYCPGSWICRPGAPDEGMRGPLRPDPGGPGPRARLTVGQRCLLCRRERWRDAMISKNILMLNIVMRN